MKRTFLITLVLGIGLALAPAANALVMSDGSGISSTATAVPTSHFGLNPAEYRALMIRSAALDQRYGLSVTIRPDILGGDGASTSPVSTTTRDSFNWNAALAGAALLGAMLLALSFAAAHRRRQRLSF